MQWMMVGGKAKAAAERVLRLVAADPPAELGGEGIAATAKLYGVSI